MPNSQLIVDRLLEIERREGLDHFLAACRSELEKLRRSLDDSDWKGFVESVDVARLRAIFMDCPYTRRGFEKPRGYAGDAVLLDYIYETGPIPDATPNRGRRIYNWMCKESTAFQAVRHRRSLLASRIESVVSAKPEARILSIACGHLREFALCKINPREWRGELLAVDQDPRSLSIVANTYNDQKIVPTRASIATLLNDTANLGKFDFVYAAGLLDYLDDATVSVLASWCHRSLKDDGDLLVANFSQCQERGFMEAIMQWPLIYRKARDLSKLVQGGGKKPVRGYSDPFEIVAYAESF